MFLFSVISLLKTTSLKRGENSRDLARCPTLISLIEKCFSIQKVLKKEKKKKRVLQITENLVTVLLAWIC
jgi:hypothetical protein